MFDQGAEQKTISISSGTIVRAILFVLFFVLLYILRDIALVILTAVVLASAIEPGTRWFENHGVPRALGVLLIYLSTAMLLAIGFYFFIPPLLESFADVLSRAPEYLESLRLWGGSIGVFDGVSGDLTTGELVTRIQGLLTSVSGGVFGFASNVFGGVLSLILIVVLSFYLAVQKDGIANFLRIVTPFKYESYAIDLWKRSQRKIGRWLQGQLILSLIVGVLVYLGLTILGVPNALLLAILAAIFELIPLFGPILAAVPAVAVALIEGGAPLGIMVIGLYLIIQQFENHLLHPLVVKKVVGVPALVAIIALLAGAKLAGFLGMIIAVPIATVLMEFMNDVETRKKRMHEEFEKNQTEKPA